MIRCNFNYTIFELFYEFNPITSVKIKFDFTLLKNLDNIASFTNKKRESG